MNTPLVIWTNADWAQNGAAGELFTQAMTPHRIVQGNETLHHAHIAFGGPPVDAMMQCQKLRWVQVTSAGYTPYDRPHVWAWFREKKVAFTNGSSVFDEGCAEHLLAMMLGLARQLPACVERQRQDRAWSQGLRGKMRALKGESAILYGYGAIAKRLAELLAPFRMELVGVRRRRRGDEGIAIVTPEEADGILARFDHVVNILPANNDTQNFFDARRFAKMKRGAWLYNIGRGTTVVQPDLVTALAAGQVGAAYLDVTDPEPLPKENILWSTPNCWITPHIGGGYFDERERVVRHFIDNLHRFEAGQPLADRVA